MKVSELIEKLKEHPPDMEVFFEFRSQPHEIKLSIERVFDNGSRVTYGLDSDDTNPRDALVIGP